MESELHQGHAKKEPTMLIDAPIRAYLPVSDLPRARRFYEEVVGLEPREEYAGGVRPRKARTRSSSAASSRL